MRAAYLPALSMTSSSSATALPAHPSPEAPAPIAPGISTPVLLLMAVACGLCAGSNYFNQPLLHSIATQLQVRDASAALIVTLAQVAYAAGLLLLVPLGDLLERRRLIVTLMLLAAFGLFTSGLAHSYAMLALGTLLTGLFSVAAQVLVPLPATLAAPGATLNKFLAHRAPLLWAVCSVANPRDSYGYRCGLRLASHPKPGRAPLRGLIQRCLRSQNTR